MSSAGRVKQLLAAQPLNCLHVCHVHSAVGQDTLKQHSGHSLSFGMLAVVLELLRIIYDPQAHAQV